MAQAVFWECTDTACALRFPEVGERIPAERRCPRCGAPLRREPPLWLEEEGDLPPAEAPAPSPLPRPAPGARLAVLDNLRSAWNVGSIFRSADGAGWHHLCLAGFTPLPTHPKVAKTALGAERRVPWSAHPNAVRLAWRLHTLGWRLWALETVPQAQPLPACLDAAAGQPIALVVGNERAGVDPALLALCERVVALPMRGVKRSLNVAMAFAVAAYWLAPQSSPPPTPAEGETDHARGHPA